MKYRIRQVLGYAPPPNPPIYVIEFMQGEEWRCALNAAGQVRYFQRMEGPNSVAEAMGRYRSNEDELILHSLIVEEGTI